VTASSLGEGPMAGCCEHGTEPSGSIKSREFLELPNDYYLLNDLAPLS